MASVAKWLRQWIVVPPFVGSIPIVRPFSSVTNKFLDLATSQLDLFSCWMNYSLRGLFSGTSCDPLLGRSRAETFKSQFEGL